MVGVQRTRRHPRLFRIDSEGLFLYRGTSRSVDLTASAEMTVPTIEGP